MPAHKHRTCYSCDKAKEQTKEKSFLEINKSKNVLDIKIVPGHPTGAWVECYNNTFDIDAQSGVAERNAQRLAKTTDQLMKEKDERLKLFQDEVSRRVACLQKFKKQQLHMRKLRNIEEEQNVVLQRTLGLKFPYRGTMEDLQALNKELLKSCIIPCDVNKQLIRNEVEESNKMLHTTSKEVQHQTAKARESLLTKRLEENDYASYLPGGSWSKEDYKKIKVDSPSVEVFPTRPPIFNRPIADTWTGVDEIKSNINHSNHDNKECPNMEKTHSIFNEDLHENILFNIVETKNVDSMELPVLPTVCKCLNMKLYATQFNMQKDVDHVQIGDEETGLEQAVINGRVSCCEKGEETGENDDETDNALNCFSQDHDDLISVLQRNLIFDLCQHEQKQSEYNKNQKKHQYWKYRKIFMDIERDQVQERRRKDEHRKRIMKLKIEKEKERLKAEENVSEFTEKKPSPTAITKTLEVYVPTSSHKKTDRKNRNNKEIYRYIDALRAVAKERLEISNITIPPLCQCGGATFWDTHPETCANNCVFYRNPKAYVKALTSALSNNR